MERWKISNLVCAAVMSYCLAGCSTSPQQPELLAQVMAQMVEVEGGEFVMGAGEYHRQHNDAPAHLVSLDSFAIGRFEVTQGLYHQVMGSSISYFYGDDNPVNNISHQQALSFIQRLNQLTGQQFRLPTEAEWEFAARGGVLSKGYRFAGSDDIDSVAWYRANSNNKAHPVGRKQANELGLYDMTGNVGEYVADAYLHSFYRTSEQHNPVNAQEDGNRMALKVVRGGSFSFDPDESASVRRDWASQSAILADMGLRLAMDD